MTQGVLPDRHSSSTRAGPSYKMQISFDSLLGVWLLLWLWRVVVLLHKLVEERSHSFSLCPTLIRTSHYRRRQSSLASNGPVV